MSLTRIKTDHTKTKDLIYILMHIYQIRNKYEFNTYKNGILQKQTE